MVGCSIAVQAQQAEWKRYVINSNLVVDLPGRVDSGLSMSMDIYTYNITSARHDGLVFMVMEGSSKEEIHLKDQREYRRAMDRMTQGLLSAAEEKKLISSITDTVIDGLPARLLLFEGSFLGVGQATGAQYSFLVGGKAYSFYIMRPEAPLSASDSSSIYRFISSIKFADGIAERNYHLIPGNANKQQPPRPIVGIILILLIIAVVVLYVVRSLRRP